MFHPIKFTNVREFSFNSSQVIFNLGMILQASCSTEESEEHRKYILSKIRDLYVPLKMEVLEDYALPHRILIDYVVRNMLRLNPTDVGDGWMNWPLINGPREDGTVPNLMELTVSQQHISTIIRDATLIYL